MLELRIPLVLGSRSPRRRELLQSVGLSLAVVAADVDESVRPGEAPLGYVERIARAKLAAARGAIPQGMPRPLAVLVADTTVTLDGEVLGKPDDAAHALEMLTRLAGRTHEVLTCYGIVLVGADDVADDAAPHEEVVRTVASRVWMRSCSKPEIGRYVASGEPSDKAGAYAIQGLGAVLIERIEGSYSGVVGLPLCEVIKDLERLGVVGPSA